MKKILFEIPSDHGTMAYETNKVETSTYIYHFHSPLISHVEIEKEGVYVKNDMLDIIGYGINTGLAYIDFADQFEYIYNRYNSLSENQLSSRLNRVKRIVNLLTDKVEKRI